jgi:hypothetical protein
LDHIYLIAADSSTLASACGGLTMNHLPGHIGYRQGASIRTFLLAIAFWGCSDLQAWANISFVSLFRNLESIQIGDGDSLVDTGAFFSAGLEGTVADQYSAVSMTYPGPDSPVVLSQIAPTSYAFQSFFYFIQASMDSNFPTGTYNFDATHASGTDSTSVSYAGDDYPQSSPYVDGTDYSDLQGMNPGQAFVVNFSTFTTGATADQSFIFFTIVDETDSAVAFDQAFLPSTSTELTIPANTLAPNHDFSYTLIYSNRDLVSSPGADFDGVLAFDLRTIGTFSTAIPESTTAVYITVVGAILGRIVYGVTRRRRINVGNVC